MIGEVRIAATFDMYVNAGGSNSPPHSVFIEKYFAGTSASRGEAGATRRPILRGERAKGEAKRDKSDPVCSATSLNFQIQANEARDH